MPAAHLQGLAPPPAERARPAQGRRAAGAPPQVDRGDQAARAARLLPPPRTAAARALDLPPLGPAEPPLRRGPDRGHQHQAELRRHGPLAAQPHAPPAAGRLHRPRARAAARAPASAPGCCKRSLLVVVADHGYAYDIGVPSRRFVSDSNVDEVGPVPLFIKAPGQMRGRVDDSMVRNIDVVPTIGDMLGRSIWWPHDGDSVFSPASQGPRRARDDDARLQARDQDRRGRARRAARGEPGALGAPVRHERVQRASLRRPVGERLPRRPEPAGARPAARATRPGRLGRHGAPRLAARTTSGTRVRARIANAEPARRRRRRTRRSGRRA